MTWLDIGSPGDDSFITGAFPPEQNQTESYRWTTSSAIVTVPAPSGSRYRLDIAIASTGDEPRTLQINCPGDELIVPLGTGSTPPILSLVCHSGGGIPVIFNVPEVRVPGDGRPLGIALRDIRVSAIDREVTSVWRLRAASTVATSVLGIWLAVASLAGRRRATVAALGCLVLVIAVSLRRPDWIGVAVYGPSGVIALAAGYAAWMLQAGRRTGPGVLGLIAVASWLLLPPPNPARLLPALWTPHDATGYELLPWLAALSIVAASLIGGQRARLLAAAAALLAAGTPLTVIVARPILERWSLAIDGPDWTDVASPVGGLLLAATAIIACVAFYTSSRSPMPPRFVLLATVVLALAVLVPWRNTVMDLNGDEPHYYVTAHSIAADADLELLDDYLDREYLANTISPTGNIAVDRATRPDRYAAFTATPEDSRYIIPDASTGLSISEPGEAPPDATRPILVTSTDGDRETLPALIPGSRLNIPVSGPCQIETVQIGTADNAPATVNVSLLNETGIELWRTSIAISNSSVTFTPPLDRTTCAEDFAGTLALEATSDIIAQAIDTASGLRILPAHAATTDWLLGPLPRDRYATQEATARITLHNPGQSSVDATLTLLTPNEMLLRATDITLDPGATVSTDADLHNGAAVAIRATAPIVAGGTGWLPGGSFALPVIVGATQWTIDIPGVKDRDAGVWLAIANLSPDPRTVSVEEHGSSRTIAICGFCADMLHFLSRDQTRDISISTTDGPVGVAAILYEERTAALHFDLGLPLLATLPVLIAGPDAAPFVSALATILLAVGLFDLLRRVGISDQVAVWGAGAAVLLAPLSPYAVRLYTETLAACIIVWALVYWDRARARPEFAIAVLLLAGALPIVHGRYTPLAILLGVMAVVAGARHTHVSRRRLVGLAALAVVLIAVIAVSPVAVALRERASGSYFSTQWVPHNLPGILVDRGSGLLPIAPWCLLALAAGRRLHPLQLAAILAFVTQLTIVALRAGGWQTFGAPARYILPVVPLLALLAVPGWLRLWRSRAGQLAVSAILGWSVGATVLLHWLPLTGYIYEGRYFIDDARRQIPVLAPVDLLPSITPAASSNLLGVALLLGIWTVVWAAVRQIQH